MIACREVAGYESRCLIRLCFLEPGPPLSTKRRVEGACGVTFQTGVPSFPSCYTAVSTKKSGV